MSLIVEKMFENTITNEVLSEKEWYKLYLFFKESNALDVWFGCKVSEVKNKTNWIPKELKASGNKIIFSLGKQASVSLYTDDKTYFSQKILQNEPTKTYK